MLYYPHKQHILFQKFILKYIIIFSENILQSIIPGGLRQLKFLLEAREELNWEQGSNELEDDSVVDTRYL